MCSKYKITIILTSLTLLSADIDFDALDNFKKAKVSDSHNIAINGQKRAKEIAHSVPVEPIGLVKSAAKFVKSVGEQASTHPNSSSYKPCGTYDTCHKVIEVINARRIKIECTRGSNTGQIREMCANTHGKWAQGCGFTDIAAHHWKSLGDAAKRYCD